VPALAPLLGLAALPGAYPALAGRARGWAARAALGALGAWWTLLAASLLGRAMLGESPAPLGSSPEAALDAVAPRSLIYAAVWASAALILPWLVRGRWLALDIVAASAWAAALGAGTAAAAQAIGAPEPPGLALATFVAGLIAVAIPHIRRIAVLEP
jgi:hypothetical protein